MIKETKTFVDPITGQEHFLINGIEIEKNVAFNEEVIDEKYQTYFNFCEFFIQYPDIFIDIITPPDSYFRLYFYQRIFLRACMRYRYHYCVAPRAFSKSFISILAEYLKCMFQPGYKTFICAPKKEQSAKIAGEKIKELWDLFPILKKEIVGGGNFGSDYVKLTFKCGSILDVVGALDSSRGGRRNGGLIDEVRDHDAQLINEVVLPLMNVKRRTKARKLNPHEPQPSIFMMTSAGDKISFAYDRLIELFIQSIIMPKTAFVWGCTYRIPLQVGLLDKDYLNELKMSASYSEDSFARE